MINPTIELALRWIKEAHGNTSLESDYSQADLISAARALQNQSERKVEYGEGGEKYTGTQFFHDPKIGEAKAHINMAISRLKGVLSILDDYRPEKGSEVTQ